MGGRRMSWTGTAILAVAVGLVASAVPAAAAPTPATPADFDAPLFGTTATLTEGRMPTYAAVKCSDARCSTGVLTSAAGGATGYISTTVARGGVFADSPFFVAKLNKSWSNTVANTPANGGPTEDYSTFTINLAQINPGADIPGLIAADVARYGGTLGTSSTVDGTTVWPATAEYRKGLWTMVYVSKGDALARGVCIQFGKEQGSVTCQPANIQALTVGTVNAPASTRLAEQASIRGLVPATPKGLTPVFLNIEPTKPLWEWNAPTPALERSLGKRKNSVALQYRVAKFPELLLDAKIAALTTEAPARPWTKTICTYASKTDITCELSRVAGPAFGYIGVSRDPGEGGKPVGVNSHFTGSGKLADVSCHSTRTPAVLKPAEVVACRAAINALAGAVTG